MQLITCKSTWHFLNIILGTNSLNNGSLNTDTQQYKSTVLKQN